MIEESPTSILYEWWIGGCVAAPDQHEVARVLDGHAGVHRVAFVAKGERMPDHLREEWIERLRQVIIVRDGVPIDPESGEPLADEIPARASGTP